MGKKIQMVRLWGCYDSTKHVEGTQMPTQAAYNKRYTSCLTTPHILFVDFITGV